MALLELARRRAGGSLRAIMSGTLCIAASCEAPEDVVRVQPALRIVPTAVDFGAQPVGGWGTRTIAIINGGNAAWSGPPAAVEGDGFVLLAPCVEPLGPQEFCEAEVAFVPRAEGTHQGSFRLEGPEGALESVLVGRATAPDIVFEPGAVELGALDVGTSVRSSVTATSLATRALEIWIATEGDGFAVATAGEPALTRRRLTLAPGASAPLEVVFAPGRSGPHTGRLVAETCGAGCGPAAPLAGVGRAARLEVAPRRVDLGEVPRGAESDAGLVVRNDGDGELVVRALDVLTSTPELTLQAPPLPLRLGPGEEASAAVRFRPVVSRAALDAVVRIVATDPVTPEVQIPVVASTAGPALELLPRALHFGVLDEGASREVRVALRSTGSVAAMVAAVDLEGQADGFELSSPPPVGVLAPGESALVHVRVIVPVAAVDRGGGSGRLVVRAAGLDDVELPLAFLSGTAGCQPRVATPNAALGAVRVGRTAAGSIAVRNVGDDVCSLGIVRLAPGLPFDPAFSFSTARARTLAPGAQGEVDVRFDAVAAGLHSAMVGLSWAEQRGELLISATARGVTGSIVAEPPLLRWGPLGQGCDAGRRMVSFVNRGGDEVRVLAATLASSAAPLGVDASTLPTRLMPGGTLAVALTASTAAAGLWQAEVRADTDLGLSATARIELEVVAQGEPVTETFVAASAPDVDVLFVIDNSGSMADDQEILAANFERFIAAAQVHGGVTPRVGVTTTDVLGGTGGPLVGPVIQGTGAAAAMRFREQALVGTEGNGVELGLEAMRRALDDFAATRNAGFLRGEAALGVIIVSDEEDNGGLPELPPEVTRPVESYVELLRGLKAESFAHTPVLVSVVVTPSSSPRYEAVARAFHGLVLDITSDAWGERLAAVGEATFSLARQFRLASAPIPGTVVVTVNGAVVDGFVVDAGARTVTLDEPAPAGALVDITYVAGCT